jgi:7-cyano-7-deazaguanine synthase
MGRNAVVLLSGGLDSATVLALAKRDGFDVYALSFSYGQRHDVEISRAKSLAKKYSVKKHVIANIDLRVFGGSALTDDIDVPKGRDIDAHSSEIPVTYVPARNTIFLSYALAFAEVSGARDIFIGVNALDYSGYPDCRPEFIAAFEHLANLATKSGVEGVEPIRIRAPLIDMTKKEIVMTGTALGIDYSLTSSCYDPTPDGKACGSCDACQLRLRGFADAGLQDPAEYATA